MSRTTKISVVIPCYKCEDCLVELYRRLVFTLEKITDEFEIIFVNDASPQKDWTVINQICAEDKRVRGINFSRNFGQHFAITAGLDYTSGDWVIVMDADLQDQPEDITKFYSKAMEGYDVVLGRRVNRNDPLLKKYLSKLYYNILSYLSETSIDATVGTYRIVSRQVVSYCKKMNEKRRFLGAMIDWLGFNVGYVDIEHSKRKYGKTSYNFSKLFKLGFNGILSFSTKPLKLAINTGLLLSLISGAFIAYKVLLILFYGTQAIGWSSLIASIFFSTGLIISVLGITGLYIGCIFDEVKNRPLYVIKDKLNITGDA